MGLATKPTVTIGDATKKKAYDDLVNFVCGSEELDGDAGYNLTTSDFGKTVKVNSAAARTVNLPSVDSAHVGGWFIIVKLGAGNVTIQTADSDIIADGAAGGILINSRSDEIYAIVVLKLISATKWSIIGGVGTWTTSATIFTLGRTKIAQVIIDTDDAASTKSTGFPNDDTIPQITEGDEILSCAITPKNASSTILMLFKTILIGYTDFGLACLFKSNSNDALLSTMCHANITMTAIYTESADSTDTRTYSVRVGDSTGNNVIVNKIQIGGLDKFGATEKSRLVVMEVLP